MPSWGELLTEFQQVLARAQNPDDLQQEVTAWTSQNLFGSLSRVSAERGGSNVVLYASGFLQKPHAEPYTTMVTREDLNGFMACMHGMDFDKPLTLVLHTPGGELTAVEPIVEYLRSKFSSFEVIVPTYAMSAGTMVALGSDRVVLGRQSQLGPTDPQMILGGSQVSARAVVEQFERATLEITADTSTAHLWAPILQEYAPATLQAAQNVLDYSERLVRQWLTKWMLREDESKARQVAEFFNDATEHKEHGRRIGFEEVAARGVVAERLEDSQELQEAVLTAYHAATILFENGPATKMICSGTGAQWVKNAQIAPPPPGPFSLTQVAPIG